MTWLVAHMWIALAGAALVALLLGWSLRGMLLIGRLRRAEVDRDVTKVELGEARDEIERLFAAQRKLLAGQGGAQAFEATQVSPQADPALEQQLAETLSALRMARDELDALKAAPPVLAPAPEMAAVPAIDGAAVLRTRELEDRVAALEADLAQAQAGLAAAEVARAEAVAAAAVPAMPAQTEAPPVAEPDPKLAWKASYLALRVKALENEVAAKPVLPVLVAAAPVIEEAAPVVAEPVTPAAPPADEEPVEEELARLRWRNRYLEGRLAYFEGDQESVADEIAGEDAEAIAELERELEPESAGEAGPAEAAEAYDDYDDAAEDYESEEEDGFEDEDEDEGAFAAETILGRLEEEDALADAGEAESVVPARPLALERPVEGAPDDLTLIGGIGPRIQEVLNSLGIFHFDQIADWSPENIAWIDEYLHFSGRVKREGWVEQAAILVGEAADI